MLSTIVAGALSLAAIALIYKSWRTRAPAFFYLGIGVLFLSCVGWSFSQGWEFGLVYALCIPALLVWPFIGANQTHHPPAQNAPIPKQIEISFKQSATNAGHLLVVLVLLLITSLLSTLAVCLHFPFDITGKLALVIVILPVTWGMLIYHYFAVSKKGKAIASYVCMAVISTAVLIYVPV